MINRHCSLAGFNSKLGTALVLVLAVSSLARAAPPIVQIVHSFNGSDGRSPSTEAPLVRGPLGSVFGVTQVGGATDEGAMFFVDPLDGFHLIRSFSTGGERGVYPNSLAFSDDGTLFGTTAFGGAYGCGTLFRVGWTGSAGTVHSFDCVKGNIPSGRIVVRDGSVIGSTGSGGSTSGGSIYRVSSTGEITVLYEVAQHFSNEAGMYWGLRSAPNGDLIGATMGWDIGDFHGVVLRVDAAGVTTILHTFGGGADGSRPTSAPVVAADGTIYGTTFQGGLQDSGTVYKISPQGDYSVLYSFTPDQAGPFSGLVLGHNGRLYGTTVYGGQTGNGTVFELKTNGQLRVVYEFNGVNNFGYPQGGLVETTPGTFYGTTGGGGDFQLGTIYKLKVR